MGRPSGDIRGRVVTVRGVGGVGRRPEWGGDQPAPVHTHTDAGLRRTVRCVSQEPLSLTAVLAGLCPVDGVPLVTGDRVLLTAQADAQENGVHVTDGTRLPSWVGLTVLTSDGETHAHTLHCCTDSDATSGWATFVPVNATRLAGHPVPWWSRLRSLGGADSLSLVVVDGGGGQEPPCIRGRREGGRLLHPHRRLPTFGHRGRMWTPTTRLWC